MCVCVYSSCWSSSTKACQNPLTPGHLLLVLTAAEASAGVALSAANCKHIQQRVQPWLWLHTFVEDWMNKCKYLYAHCVRVVLYLCVIMRERHAVRHGGGFIGGRSDRLSCFVLSAFCLWKNGLKIQPVRKWAVRVNRAVRLWSPGFTQSKVKHRKKR